MGFPRADIDRAMRAAFFNPDRAVEYLLNVCLGEIFSNDLLVADTKQGIPERIQQEQQSARSGGTGGRQAGTTAATAPTTATGAAPPPAEPSTEAGDQPVNLFEAAAQAGRGGSGGSARTPRQPSSAATGLREGLGVGAGAGAGAGAAGAAGGLGNLEFLRNNAQFQQLRAIVQAQPAMLEPILQQVGAGNPQLAQLIGQHPEQFLQLLSEEREGDVPLPPGAQEISVTEEERAAIERVSIAFFFFSQNFWNIFFYNKKFASEKKCY